MTDILFAIGLILFIVFIMIRNLTTGDQQHSINAIELGLTKPLYATIRSLHTPKPSSTREILLLIAVQYAWLMTKIRMCCACCLIVVISFMSSVLTRGYNNMQRARVSDSPLAETALSVERY
ncbi:hypothetical protein CFP56_043308 [Quercus suber]|uniref:ATP synthase F0 subunit 8 n=1 Tax=Quercus suber TaxID=58331 RepID=A0AAW0LI21_QUESU